MTEVTLSATAGRDLARTPSVRRVMTVNAKTIVGPCSDRHQSRGV